MFITALIKKKKVAELFFAKHQIWGQTLKLALGNTEFMITFILGTDPILNVIAGEGERFMI